MCLLWLMTGLVAVSLLAACGGGVPFASHATSFEKPSALSRSPFSFSTTSNLTASMKVPSAGGFSGTVGFSGSIQQYAQVTQTLQDVAFTPATGSVLVYYGLNFDAALTSPVALNLNVPAKLLNKTSQYYLAFYDPQRPSLGWQSGYAGPASMPSTGTLSFTGTKRTFNRYEQYWFAAYALGPSAPKPTPAPRISPVVTPSPAPSIIASIQARLSQLDSCSGTPCATGSIPPPTQPPATYSVVPGVTKPSLGGQPSTLLQLVGSPFHASDVLYYTPPLVSAPLATYAQFSFAYYIDQPVWSTPAPPPPGQSAASTYPGSPTVMNALEFDFNSGMPNYSYNFSSQCLLISPGGPVWQIWNGSKWINAGFACSPEVNFTPGRWHHAAWCYRWFPQNLTTQYLSLTIDGKTSTPSPHFTPFPVQPRLGQVKTFLEVQFQQDMKPEPTAPPFREWVDEVTLTYGSGPLPTCSQPRR